MPIRSLVSVWLGFGLGFRDRDRVRKLPLSGGDDELIGGDVINNDSGW